MSNNHAAESPITQKAAVIAAAMKLVVDFNGFQLKEMRRFIDLLLQIRHLQGKKDEE
ncbi:hypothetical protein [Dehalococcoides mccartyi]|jgi:hypothetical protein|uniref:hypothetical protein n=1 Tax=Dehalococcoides mccartyi TaxID=61435 RepID=UPI002FC8C6EE